MKIAGQALLIPLLALAAYWPVFDAGFIWDDNLNITESDVMQSPDGLVAIWTQPSRTLQYYPLYYSILWIQYQIWGADPYGYHSVSLCLHCINALLFWRLLTQLALPGAYIASLLYLLHPLQAETVCWATEQKNLLSALFSLLCVSHWIRFRNSNHLSAYWIGTAWFAAALLCKTVVCVLPVVICLIDYRIVRRLDRRVMMAMAPWLAVATMLSLVTMWREHATPMPADPNLNWNFGERILIASKAVVFYWTKLCLPIGLAPIYPTWKVGVGMLPYLAFVIVVIALCWKYRSRFGLGPFVAVLCYFLLLAPCSGLVRFNFQKAAFVADHLVYHASFPLFALLAASYLVITQRLPAGLRHCVVATGIVLLCLLTWREATWYRTPEVYWRHAYAQNPHSCVTNFQLGITLHSLGQTQKALPFYKRAVAACPNAAIIHYNLGTVMDELGDPTNALTHLEIAGQLDPSSGAVANAIGRVLLQSGQVTLAEGHFRFAIKQMPQSADAHYNLGLSLQNRHATEAIESFETAISLRPDFAKAIGSLGVLRIRNGDRELGIHNLRQSLAIDPQAVGTRMALAEILAGDLQTRPEALKLFADLSLLLRDDPWLSLKWGLTHLLDNNDRLALQLFENGYVQSNGWPPLAQSMAWILSTSAEHDLRDGKRAVQLIERVLRSPYSDWHTLEVAAACYAEDSQFEKALQYAKQVEKLLPPDRPDVLSGALRRRMFYEQHQPFRSEPNEVSKDDMPLPVTATFSHVDERPE